MASVKRLIGSAFGKGVTHASVNKIGIISHGAISFLVLLLFAFLRQPDYSIAAPEETKNVLEDSPPPDSDPLSGAEFRRNLACRSMRP
jgi:hypothetical protein